MNGAVAKAESIAANMEGGHAFILGQFDNPTNPKAHRWDQLISFIEHVAYWDIWRTVLET